MSGMLALVPVFNQDAQYTLKRDDDCRIVVVRISTEIRSYQNMSNYDNNSKVAVHLKLR